MNYTVDFNILQPDACHDWKLPKLIPQENHQVLFDPLNLESSTIPTPSPDKFIDIWDEVHIRMPCSSQNLYPIETNDGKRQLQNRWDIIVQALSSSKIHNSHEFEEAIMQYNSQYASRWDFSGFHAFCNQPVKLLRAHVDHSVTMSQKQAAVLLANAFFSTFPRRNSLRKNLFSGINGGLDPRKAEKLKCLLHYFSRISRGMPTGALSFSRRMVDSFPAWSESQTPLARLCVLCGGAIEDALGFLQVDFANRCVGGGVLNHGLVQEEIRFLICPELIISRLFTEYLLPNECLVITGCERFSNYVGYADTFQWYGDFSDTTPRDKWRRLKTEVVAIDALDFSHNFRKQFTHKSIVRELNKAFCGFSAHSLTPEVYQPVATGNWGCGAFSGDYCLKVLIQLMAAAEMHRDICYYTFNDEEMKADVTKLYNLLMSKNAKVGDICTLLTQFDAYLDAHSPTDVMSLFEFIERMYTRPESIDFTPKPKAKPVINDRKPTQTAPQDGSATQLKISHFFSSSHPNKTTPSKAITKSAKNLTLDSSSQKAGASEVLKVTEKEKSPIIWDPEELEFFKTQYLDGAADCK